MDAHTGIGAGPIDVIARWLATNIGPRLVAYAAGITRTDLTRVMHGECEDAGADKRLRNLFAVCSYKAAGDGPGSAHDFLLEPNDDLNGRAPAELLRDGAAPERVWLAAVPPF
jgi:hypothetical protein